MQAELAAEDVAQLARSLCTSRSVGLDSVAQVVDLVRSLRQALRSGQHEVRAAERLLSSPLVA